MRVLGLLALIGGSAAFDDPSMGSKAWLARVRAGPRSMDDKWWVNTCAGWSAHTLCGAIFNAGLPYDQAIREDVTNLFAIGTLGTVSVNYTERSAKAKCILDPFGQAREMKSIWRQGVGCTLIDGPLNEAQIRAQDLGDQRPPAPLDPTVAWPRGEAGPVNTPPAGIDMQCVQRAVEANFAAPIWGTRAVVVIYKEQLVFERYAANITKTTQLLGWSATKSLTNALLSLAVKQGGIDIKQPADVPEWRVNASDGRRVITPDMLSRMTAGTEWGNDVIDVLETTGCLYNSDGDCAHFCSLKPLVRAPDSKWEYNSGSFYVLSRLALEKRKDQAQYNNFEWPKKQLFNPIGAHSMFIEYQPNKIFLGAGLGFGTARDWARFGLLFKRDGVWIDGNRILPEGWAKYVATPSSGPSHSDTYGSGFWRMPTVDPNLFYADGFRNQNVFVFPTHDLVIARLAMAQPFDAEEWEQKGKEAFLRSILPCVRTE